MLYLYYGTDRKKASQKLADTVAVLKSKRPEAEVYSLDGALVSVDGLRDLATAGGLFEAKHIVILRDMFTSSNSRGVFDEVAEELKQSIHPFLLLEGTLNAESKKLAEKFFEKTNEFKLPEKVKPNFFAVADAYASGKRERAWLVFREALSLGESVEAIHGIVFWKAKSMLLASLGNGKDVSPNSKKWRDDIKELVSMYHIVRTEGGSLENMFERFLILR